jgi:glyceraldehyde 3-phosphate dehydrogenase
MKVNVAINGFGRIGRAVLRAAFEENFPNINIVAVNGTQSAEASLHLFRYDSVHGRFSKDATVSGGDFVIAGNKVTYLSERDPEKLNWAKLGVDVVLECTGKFTKRQDAEVHLRNGAKRVLISAPATDPDITVVYGVNDTALKPEHRIVSVGSCTTNCLAPLAKALNDSIGIDKGFMTTIHAFTSDQNIHDGSHKDLRRARAATLSMVPTSTGAAKALGEVLPELKGKLDGTAIRVPTANVSMVDLKFIANRNVTADEVNNAVLKASKSPDYHGVLIVNTEELVSVDFNHTSASSVFDATQTKVTGGNLVRVAAWYDNEWAFSLRMLDVASLENL